MFFGGPILTIVQSSFLSFCQFQSTTSKNHISPCLYDASSHNDDHHTVIETVRKGKIYVRHNFITPTEVRTLRNDIDQLKNNNNNFLPSGLSNRTPGDRNVFDETDRLTCTLTPDLWKGDVRYSSVRTTVEDRLESLKCELEVDPSHADEGKVRRLKLDEMYYSTSPKGSSLLRHQDERHEETKGGRGWIYDGRRSISWLIYLNEDWGVDDDDGGSGSLGSGGELRAFCRKCVGDVYCGSNDGDLQVGWLGREKEVDDASGEREFEPVFLDSWIKTPNDDDADERRDDGEEEYERLKWRPMSALYRMKTKKMKNGRSRDESQTTTHHEPILEREFLSKPFGPDSPTWPSEINLQPSEFVDALASQLRRKDHRERFVGTEEIDDPDVEIVDVVPSAGTLVLFDSVVVPHEVSEVRRGERLAIAGWFHERQQPFPDWYGT